MDARSVARNDAMHPEYIMMWTQQRNQVEVSGDF